MNLKEFKNGLLKEVNKVCFSQSENLKNTPINAKEQVIQKEEVATKRIPFKISPYFVSAACFLLIACMSLCFFMPSQKVYSSFLTSYILEINPAFCITTNEDDDVVNVCALNNDADFVLDDESFDDIIGVPISSCVERIFEAIDDEVFDDYGDNKIELYALNDNKSTMSFKLNSFGDLIRQNLDRKGFQNIEFNKNEMNLGFFINKMGFEQKFERLDDMKKIIESHRMFFDENHNSNR